MGLLVAGCQLPDRRDPVFQSLVDCRQLSQKGIVALEQGRRAEAEALLVEAVQACPLDPQARRHYAETLWQRDAADEAIAQLQEAVRLATEDATLRVRLTEMLLATGQTDRARRSAVDALDADPKLSACWAMRGRVMRAQGNARQALADYHRALGYSPDDRQVLMEVAELYRESNEPQRALSTLHNLAESYSPGDEPQRVLYLIGLAYLALDRYEDAATSLSAALCRDQPTAEIYYRWGQAEWLAGRPTSAATAANNALTLLPTHRPSRQLLERIQLARQSQAESRR